MQYDMAAEVNQNYFTWSQEESSVQDSSQETPQVFDHGSISFGRFELESLAWEKWSVFTNDRRHEEFLKFNGLVAKKKAYFEEYFKRIRELKALQQQNQQTELNLEYSGDGSDSSQTGEDEPVADQRSAGSGAHHDDSMEHIVAKTTSEHELESYKGHQYDSLNNEISASNCSLPVGGLQLIDQEISGNTGSDNSDKMDMLQQSANCCQGDLKKSHEIMMAPQRTIGKNSQISQASKIIPKTVKMTSSNHTIAYKVPMSGKPRMISQNSEQYKVKLLRRPQAAISMVGTSGRSKLMAEGAPGVISVRRPSSSASQRPSTRERRPVTRDGSRKPSDIDTPCRPSTAEKFPATRGLAPKQACAAASRRPSTAERHPFTKDSKHASITTTCRPSTAERYPFTKDSKHASITTTCRPSTAERRPVIRDGALRHTHIATSCRPSTVERHPVIRDVVPKHGDIVNPCELPVTRGTAQKHADVVTLRRPSTAEKRPVTRETKQKYADVFTLRRPSTAERRSVSREIAPKHANVPPSCRPSTAERGPATRDFVLKHANVASPCWSSTPERCLRRESAQKHSDISTTPHRPTGERHPITKESTLKLDPATPFRLRGMLSHSKGAMATTATPSKTINPNLVKNCKPEIKRHVNERMEHPLGIQKSSSVNFPPKKMLSSNVRANGVQENIRKPNKEDILDTVRSRVSASKNITPLQTGRRTPNPPPPPPPLHRSSQIASKPNPNNFSVGARKPKASAPRWH